MLKMEYGKSYPYLITEEPPRSDVLLIAEEDGRVGAYARATKISNTLFEFGSLIVHPAYRGRGYAKALLRRRLEIIILENPDVTIFTQPVCYRKDRASQESCRRHGGFRQLGIQVAKHPGIHQDLMGSQPESLAFAVRENGKQIFSGNGISVPQDWQEIIPLLCKEMESKPLLQTAVPPPIHHHAYKVNGLSGAEFIDIPANWEESEELIRTYRKEGYGFSALLPRFGKRGNEVFDLIRLYRYREKRINWSLIHVTEDLIPLKEFMKSDERAREYSFGAVR